MGNQRSRCKFIYPDAFVDNSCESEQCKNRIVSGIKYCDLHKCELHFCPEKKLLGSTGCSIHRCMMPTCPNVRACTRINYCDNHLCQVSWCDSSKLEDEFVCMSCKKLDKCQLSYCQERDRTHNHAYHGYSMYICSKHQCSVPDCTCVIVEKIPTALCKLHKCSCRGCPNIATSIQGRCRTHKPTIG